MRLRIFNYNYYNVFDNKEDESMNCPVLVVCGREENGKLHIIKIPGNEGIFRPHFYVEDTESNRQIIEQLPQIKEYDEWPYPSVYDPDEKVLIAFTTYPYEVKQVRDYFEHTYEADVTYEKMFIMKLNLEGGYMECPDEEWINPKQVKSIPEEEHFYVRPRIYYVDIETEQIDPEKGFDLDNQVIISIVVYDNYDNEFRTLEWDIRNKEDWFETRIVPKKFKKDYMPAEVIENIYHFTTERDMLKAFFALFYLRPDAIFTFNGHGGYELVSIKSESKREWHNGFDTPVIYKRGVKLNLVEEMQAMSPLPALKDKFNKYSGVYKRGKEDKCEIVIRGLTPLDFYYAEPLMKYTEKYTNFFGRSLEAYLQYFAKGGKIKHEGLSVAELKKKDLYTELLYNRIDVEGMVFIDKYFGYSDDIFDTVSLSLVPGSDVLSATRIHDFIILKESQKYCVYDTKHQKWIRDKWPGRITKRVGGYNIPIKRGIYEWTAVLDFSGLYPNITTSANAGLDTKINVISEDDDYYYDNKGRRWDKKKVINTPPAPFRTDIVSIDKKIWDKLLNFRKKYKDKLAEIYEQVDHDIEHPLYKLYWSKQYNLKTRLINNKYGASGNPGFRNFDLAIYNVPPSIGQGLLKFLEKKVLKELGTFARGGDSVTGDTPILVMNKDNEIEIKTIDEIDTTYKVWSDKGFTNIKRVIKHKVNKRLYRVLTNCGCVDVTEDHSLLDNKENPIKPSELNIKDELLHSYPEIFSSTNIIGEESKAFGLFYADGSCGCYDCPSGKKHSWAINNQDHKLLEEMRDILNEIYKEKNISFWIADTMKSSNVYKLLPRGSIKYLVKKYRPLFYDKNKYKKVPTLVLNASEEDKKNFFKWYYKGDGSKSDGRIRLDNKGKMGSAGLFYLMKSLGYNVSINTRESKPNVFRLNGNKSYFWKPPFQVKKIIDLGICNDYVYDLETVNHHFQAGIGELIVHNTDSIFVALHSDNLDDCVKEAKEYAEKINKHIKRYMKEKFNIKTDRIRMDVEKIGPKFYGHLKKNYLMPVWWQDGKEIPKKNRYVMYKGFEMKKKNRSDITELVQKVFFKVVLDSNSDQEILNRLIEVINRTEKIFPLLPLQKICQRINIRRSLKEYDASYMSRRAAEYANRNIGTNFGIGSSGYMAWLKNHYHSDLQPVIMFKDEHIKEVKKYDIDYESHKEKFVIEKFNLLLEAYNTDYNKIKRGSKISSVFVI